MFPGSIFARSCLEEVNKPSQWNIVNSQTTVLSSWAEQAVQSLRLHASNAPVCNLIAITLLVLGSRQTSAWFPVHWPGSSIARHLQCHPKPLKYIEVFEVLQVIPLDISIFLFAKYCCLRCLTFVYHWMGTSLSHTPEWLWWCWTSVRWCYHWPSASVRQRKMMIDPACFLPIPAQTDLAKLLTCDFLGHLQQI